MANQYSGGSKQLKQDNDMNEDLLLSDKADIFDQLQHEFEALISNSYPDISTTELSVDNAGELSTARYLTGAKQHEETDLPYLPPYNTRAKVMRTISNSAPSNRDKDGKTVYNTSVRMIIFIILAISLLMASVIGTFRAFNFSDPQHAVSDGVAEKKPQQLVIQVPKTEKNVTARQPFAGAQTSSQTTAHADHSPISQQISARPTTEHSISNQTSSPVHTGNWMINLESFDSEAHAVAYIDRLARRGIHADLITVKIKEKLWYRVRLPGFSSKLEAEKKRLKLIKKLRLKSAWISKARH